MATEVASAEQAHRARLFYADERRTWGRSSLPGVGPVNGPDSYEIICWHVIESADTEYPLTVYTAHSFSGRPAPSFPQRLAERAGLRPRTSEYFSQHPLRRSYPEPVEKLAEELTYLKRRFDVLPAEAQRVLRDDYREYLEGLGTKKRFRPQDPHFREFVLLLDQEWLARQFANLPGGERKPA